jgi:glucose-6-phosphate 3-dehydrogenase
MILEDKVSGIIITTPNNTHLKVLESIVAIKPVPVLCEKPLSSSLADAEAFSKMAPPLSTIGFNYRFNRAITKSLAVQQERGLGCCRFIELAFNKNSAITKTGIGWRDQADQNHTGGVFGDLSSHLLDLVRYISQSEINKQSLNVSLGTRVHQRDGVFLDNDDHSTAIGITNNHIQFKVRASKSSAEEEIGFHLNLICDNGELHYSSKEKDSIKIFYNDRLGMENVLINWPSVLSDPKKEIPSWADSFYLQDDAWITQLASGQQSPCLATLNDGVNVQDLISIHSEEVA